MPVVEERTQATSWMDADISSEEEETHTMHQTLMSMLNGALREGFLMSTTLLNFGQKHVSNTPTQGYHAWLESSSPSRQCLTNLNESSPPAATWSLRSEGTSALRPLKRPSALRIG